MEESPKGAPDMLTKTGTAAILLLLISAATIACGNQPGHRARDKDHSADHHSADHRSDDHSSDDHSSASRPVTRSGNYTATRRRQQ